MTGCSNVASHALVKEGNARPALVCVHAQDLIPGMAQVAQRLPHVAAGQLRFADAPTAALLNVY